MGHIRVMPGAEVGLEFRSFASKSTSCPAALPQKDRQASSKQIMDVEREFQARGSASTLRPCRQPSGPWP